MYKCLVSLMEQRHSYSGECGGGSSSGGSRGRLRPCVERLGEAVAVVEVGAD